MDGAWWPTRDQRAAKKDVLAGASGREIVHLTWHGHFDERDPLRSTLLLSDGLNRPPRLSLWR
jgi:CHAT domain-containing protein